MERRTEKTEEQYQTALANGVTADFVKADPVIEYTLWKVIKNDYPYDAIALEHNMLVPKRKATFEELTQTEREELHEIRLGMRGYDMILENLDKGRTVPEHYHIHLIVLKRS